MGILQFSAGSMPFLNQTPSRSDFISHHVSGSRLSLR